MKFLIGLLTGAALILAMNGELRHGKVVALAGSMWSVLLEGTAAYLFPTVVGVNPEATPRETREPPSIPTATPAAADPLREAEPTPALASAAAEAPALSVSAPPIAEPELVVAPVTAEPVPQIAATEFVWIPFKSQISASGFANRLALSLDHPFDVHRQGPSRYQVGFNYASDEERVLLVQQIAQITGTSR